MKGYTFFFSADRKKNFCKILNKMERENGFRACTHNLLQNETLVGLTNQILQNVAYSVALFPVEPLTLCTTVKGVRGHG